MRFPSAPKHEPLVTVGDRDEFDERGYELMIKKILVPIDGSSHAKKAVEYAYKNHNGFGVEAKTAINAILAILLQ